MHAAIFTCLLITVLIWLACLVFTDFLRRPFAFLLMMLFEILIALLPL